MSIEPEAERDHVIAAVDAGLRSASSRAVWLGPSAARRLAETQTGVAVRSEGSKAVHLGPPRCHYYNILPANDRLVMSGRLPGRFSEQRPSRAGLRNDTSVGDKIIPDQAKFRAEAPIHFAGRHSELTEKLARGPRWRHDAPRPKTRHAAGVPRGRSPMTDGPRLGATETYDCTRTECSEPPLPEPSAPAPRQRSLSRRGRTALAIAGVALASLLMAASMGCGTKEPASSENPGTEQQNLSAEAKKFIAKYGDRYSDSVSTYYAEKAYEANSTIGGAIMTDEYIANFDPAEEQMTDGKSDMLGFKVYDLPLNKKIDQAAFVEVFNDYIAGGLSNYMNHLAKNPTSEAVIDSEFEKFYSDSSSKGQPIEFTYDNEEVANLMDTCKQVVAKYGSAANYTVAQAVAYDYTDSQTGTVFTGRAVDSGHVDDQGKEVKYYFTGLDVDIAIDIDLYKGDKATRVTETLKDTELTLWRHRAVFGLGADQYTEISIGQRK